MPDLTCRRCGQSKPPLEKPPFRGELGETIHRTVCAECWSVWIGEQTKIINELRLNLGDPRGQQVLDGQMRAFLKLDETA